MSLISYVQELSGNKHTQAVETVCLSQDWLIRHQVLCEIFGFFLFLYPYPIHTMFESIENLFFCIYMNQYYYIPIPSQYLPRKIPKWHKIIIITFKECMRCRIIIDLDISLVKWSAIWKPSARKPPSTSSLRSYYPWSQYQRVLLLVIPLEA